MTTISECDVCDEITATYRHKGYTICAGCIDFMEGKTEPLPVVEVDDAEQQRRKALVYEREAALQQARGHLKAAGIAAQKALEVWERVKGDKRHE